MERWCHAYWEIEEHVKSPNYQTAAVERWKRDTLKVVEYVKQSDSTIKACTQALQTCDERVGIAQRGWDGARQEI